MRYLVTGYEPEGDEAVSSYELPAPEEAYLCRLVGVDDVDQLVSADHELDDDKLAELVRRFGLALVAAWRGETVACRGYAKRANDLAMSRRLGFIASSTAWASHRWASP